MTPSRRSTWCGRKAQRCRRGGGPRRDRPGRTGTVRRPPLRTRSQSRRQSARPSGSFRPRGRAQCSGKRLEAVEHLITIVRRDRKWNDDGARKQLVQFFEAWGGPTQQVFEGRKRLASVLLLEKRAIRQRPRHKRDDDSAVCVWSTTMPTNVTYTARATCPNHYRCFHFPERCCSRAGKCRSTFSSRDTSPWSMTRFVRAASHRMIQPDPAHPGSKTGPTSIA